MDDEELAEMLIRGWALLCAALVTGEGTSTNTTVKRAKKFESYIRGEEGE